MFKEAYDDYKRMIRDKEINDLIYERLDINGGKILKTQAKKFEVGDLIKVSANERVPADLILLYTTDKTGSVFIRTDQLDGETDWKLRQPVNLVQSGAQNLHEIVNFREATVYCEKPTANIYDFAGLFKLEGQREALTLENTMWADTVLAS